MDQQMLFMGVVDRGRAEEVLAETRAFGLPGGTVFHGEGTVSNRWLELMGLAETQKDIIVLTSPQQFEASLHEMMRARFHIHKKNRGIAFTMPLSRMAQTRFFPEEERPDPLSFRYQCIVVISDRGNSRACVAAARAAGAAGGTILHGRGAGVPAGNYFATMLQPEKDIVLFLCPTEDAPRIRQGIVEKMDLHAPGTGILFVLPVSRVSGLYENREVSHT